MNINNWTLGDLFPDTYTTYVTEEVLCNTIATEFTDFWHPRIRITPNDIVISGSTVSTEHFFLHKKPFSLKIAPFRIDDNIISFHIYDITPASQEETILNLLRAHPSLAYEDQILRLRLLPCDFDNPIYQTLRYTKLLDHKILVRLSF